MRILNYLTICYVIAGLTGCVSDNGAWHSEYGTGTPVAPVNMQYGTSYDAGVVPHSMAVLLPNSGFAADTGRQIRSGVEMAVLQNAPKNLSVSFWDTAANPDLAIQNAINSGAEVIVGPLFASDARELRRAKPASLPVLAFTSDESAVGDGVMSVSLMPTNSVEEIIKEIARDGGRSIILIAPSSQSGRTMAAVAYAAADMYNLNTNGVFYYKEKDSDSIKNTADAASLNSARTDANKQARAILSDIIANETLTAVEKSELSRQINMLSREDVVVNVPYDAVLFLGASDDSQTLASFMRYYGVDSRRVKFYGTALWDGSALIGDVTMYGAKFATLPEINMAFAGTYTELTGVAPSRLATFGYDATNLAIGMLYSQKNQAAYLLDPSGYIGIDGLVRLTPEGGSERALRVMELNGTENPRVVRNAASDFITPIYNVKQRYASPVAARNIDSNTVNPMNYIKLPERLRGKYKAKSYSVQTDATPTQQSIVTFVPADNSAAIVSSEFKPVKMESVNRTYIDSVEINN